jgi:hypothetical protein
MDTELAVSQQLINKVVKEKGLKESQFVVKPKKLLV